MLQRDYVRKKAKPKNKSRIIPNLMIAIAVTLVILFAAILYFVSTNKVHKPISPPQNVTQKPQITLPDKPEERWIYLKELENPEDYQSTHQQIKSSIEKKERQQIIDSFINDGSVNANNKVVSAPNTPNSSNWLLQCGAFKDKTNAELLRAKLAMIGVASSIKSEKLYRVTSSSYHSKAEADKVIIHLRNNGISSCIVMQK